MDELSDDQLCNEIDDLASIEDRLSQRLAEIKRAKSALKKERVDRGFEQRAVSDHALVRYLERCKGMDMEALREEMRLLAEGSTPAKDGEHHWHPSGVILVLGQDGRVITVLSGEQLKNWLGRKLKNGTRAVITEPAMTCAETVAFLKSSAANGQPAPK